MRKRNENGGEHQRLLDANREYQLEIKALKQELKMKDIKLDAERKKYETLKKAYDKYMFDYAERRENLEEIIRKYEDALDKIKGLSKKYEAEAKAKIKEITGKVV